MLNFDEYLNKLLNFYYISTLSKDNKHLGSWSNGQIAFSCDDPSSNPAKATVFIL